MRYLHLAAFEHLPQGGGVAEYSRGGILTHDIRHRRIYHLAVRAHGCGIEGGGAVGPYGRKLRVVSHKNQTALPPAAYVCYKVFEQRAAAEDLSVGRGVGEHRRLVDDEYTPLHAVYVERVFRFVVGIGALAVDAFVYCVGLGARILCQDFGGAPRRRQKHARDIHCAQHLHQRRDEGGLSRSGITVENENRGVIGRREILR